jgi:flavin-dependent dehydrogenase
MKYDVVIVGAGPAGGQCARELSAKGKKVLLVDKCRDFSENNYSSGAAPQDLLSTYNLPDTIVGSFWNQFNIQSTHSQAFWESNRPLGPVVQFEKLRAFLIEEVLKKGGETRLGCLYQSHRIHESGVEITLKDSESGEPFPVNASVLVDATGSDRKVLAANRFQKHQAIAATGIEYHLEVSPDTSQKFGKTLTFFFGTSLDATRIRLDFPPIDEPAKSGSHPLFSKLADHSAQSFL